MPVRDYKSILFFFSVLSSMPLAASADPIVLGILEDLQCEETSRVAARLMFVNVEGRWIAMNDEYYAPKGIPLATLQWHVASFGKPMGTIALRDADASVSQVNSRDKLYDPPVKKAVPTVPNAEGEYRGWCDAPAVKPLVLSSGAMVADPENWEPFTPGAGYREKLYTPVKLVIGRFKAMTCPKRGGPYYPLEYGPADLIIYKGYRSSAGRELISIGINRELIRCELPVLAEWTGNWFLLEGDSIEHLGNQMELVDAGDYDEDGHSDLLFWTSGYNRDGYVLVYNRLGQKVEYVWDYY